MSIEANEKNVDKQIETKIQAIRLINTYAALLKDTGLLSVEPKISDEVSSCIDVNSQLNDELQKLICCRQESYMVIAAVA